MKKQSTPPPSQRGSAVIAVIGIVLIVGVIAAVVIASKSPPPGDSTPPPVMTLDATTVYNLTNLPDMPALTGTQAAPYVALQQMIDACPDFDQNHLLQMHQHLTWLLNPSEIPTNFIAAAFGSNPTGKLLFGMGSFAQNQWIQLGNKPDSCVITVGKKLNEMLTAIGEPTFKVFQ
jgi:hypothetical protein